MKKTLWEPRAGSSAGLCSVFAFLCSLCWVSIGTPAVRAQAAPGENTAPWKTYTYEKEFSFSMPEKSTVFRRGEYSTASYTVAEAVEVGAFAQGCAMLVRVFKTDDPNAVLQQEVGQPYYREAKRTELKGRGVKAYSFVKQKGETYFEALAVLKARRLFLIIALARSKDNAALKQFFSCVNLDGMVNAASPPAKANDAPSSPTTVPSAPASPEMARVTLRPVFLYTPKALYSDQARKNRVQGTVIVRAVFTAEGEVTNVEVVRGLADGLDEEAVRAAQRARFLPALKDGQPVAVRMTIEFSFSLIN